MLVLSRKTDEVISIGDDISVVVLSIRGRRVQLGITAPRQTAIRRSSDEGASPVERRGRREAAVVH